MYPISILSTAIQLASVVVPTASLKLVTLQLIGMGADVPLLIPVFTVVAYIAALAALAVR